MNKYNFTFTKVDADGVIKNYSKVVIGEEIFKSNLQADIKFSKETTDKVCLSYYYNKGTFEGYALRNVTDGTIKLITKD